jgi:hypothetical protein
LLSNYLQKRKKKKSLKSAGSVAQPAAGNDTGDEYHSGGKVRKTGLANLKKGEHVLTAKQFKRVKRGRSKLGSK